MGVELTTIPATIDQSIRLVEESRARLAKSMEENTGYSSKHAESLHKLAQSVKALSAEGRAWTATLSRLAASTSLEQRVEAAFRMVQSLSVADRQAFYKRLASAEADRADGTSFTKR